MPKTIPELKADLAAFRASKGQGTTTPAAPPAARPASPNIDKFKALDAALAKSSSTPARPEIPQDDPSALASFAKSIFSAPLTIAARAPQAVAALAGASNQQIDEFTHKIPIVGGLIADTPNNAADLKKDVGRAAQTVALGTGAPIAGGALFGAGASLEQGNDLLSAQTAVDAALGSAGGKVLEWVGKPLLGAMGKVVGVITPKIIKDVAAKGADAVAKFAATHDLPLVSPVSKPLSQGIEKGAQAVDTAINGGFRKGGAAVQRVASEQFPDLSPTKHFENVNARDIIQPTKENNSAYAKATDIFKKAQSQGIDIDKVATEQRVLHHQHAEGGKYNYADTVEQLKNSVYDAGGEKARPAIKIASYETPRVPNDRIHTEMIERINKLPDTEADAEAKEAMVKAIDRRYDASSAAARKHPDGYDLTNLHDNRIRAGKGGKYIPGVSDAPTVFKAKLSRLEEGVFRDIFDRSAPKELKIDEFRRESQKILTLADYLEKLHGKKVPEGAVKKGTRLLGRAVAATVGGKIGGFPGAILGSQYGDMLFSTFEAFENPVKARILNSLMREEPEAFKAIVDYIGVKEAERLLQKKLPPMGGSTFKKTPSTLFTTPGGVSTPIKREAFDMGAVDTGKVKPTRTDRRLKSYLDKVKFAQDADGVYTDPKDLPVIKMGPKKKGQKRLNDIL